MAADRTVSAAAVAAWPAAGRRSRTRGTGPTRSRAAKRHALVDSDGRALLLEPRPGRHPGTRDAGGPLLQASRPFFAFIECVFADAAYDHDRVATATSVLVEIIPRPPGQVGFSVLPRRWVVERLFAWIGRNRRLAKDFEATINSARAFLYAASVMLLIRRLARAT